VRALCLGSFPDLALRLSQPDGVFLRPQRCDLGLELVDSVVEGREEGGHLVLVEAPRDVLRAIYVPGRDLEDDRALGPAVVGMVGDRSATREFNLPSRRAGSAKGKSLHRLRHATAS